MRGADCLAHAMSAQGVDVVFSLSGNQIMPLYDALIDPGIRIVHTRHEAAAVFMADAYSQVTGKLGVALVTAAPGFGNALGALYTAYMQEVPVVFLSGDSPVGLDGQAPFQEFPQTAAATPFVKKSFRPESADALADAFAEAARIALTGRPGPVHIALAFDVLNGEAPEPQFSRLDWVTSHPTPNPADIRAVAGMLSGAERPLILTGPALTRSRARAIVDQLEEAYSCPVVDMESPRGLRDPALGAFAEVLSQADTILYLGKPVDFTTGHGRPPAIDTDHVMVIDPDPDNRTRAQDLLGGRLSVLIDGEVRASAMDLIKAANGASARDTWRATVRDALQYRHHEAPTDGMSPQAVCEAVQSEIDAAGDVILICDGGEFGQWSQAFTHAETRIINGTSGAIGGCLPYAIAAKIARPDATVVTMMGDGTVGFHLAEFETAAREKTPFVAVVGNDARWNAEHMIQVRSFGENRTVGCDLNPSARYDRAAIALDCDGAHTTSPAALKEALKSAFASDKPVCLDVRIEGEAAPLFSRTGKAAPGAH